MMHHLSFVEIYVRDGSGAKSLTVLFLTIQPNHGKLVSNEVFVSFANVRQEFENGRIKQQD